MRPALRGRIDGNPDRGQRDGVAHGRQRTAARQRFHHRQCAELALRSGQVEGADALQMPY